MKIENDVITFEVADFDGLTPFAQKALSVFVSDFSAMFSEDLTNRVQAAKENLKRVTEREPDVREIVDFLAAADDAKRTEIQPLLDQLKGSFLPGKIKEVFQARK